MKAFLRKSRLLSVAFLYVFPWSRRKVQGPCLRAVWKSGLWVTSRKGRTRGLLICPRCVPESELADGRTRFWKVVVPAGVFLIGAASIDISNLLSAGDLSKLDKKVYGVISETIQLAP